VSVFRWRGTCLGAMEGGRVQCRVGWPRVARGRVRGRVAEGVPGVVRLYTSVFERSLLRLSNPLSLWTTHAVLNGSNRLK
jgi:hypothetical protein